MPAFRHPSALAAVAALIGLPLLALAAPARAQGDEPDAWMAMCNAQEKAVRGCVMRSGKYLAFCIPKGQDLRPANDPDAPMAAPPVAYMQYRFGAPGAPELVYPERLAGSAAKFRVRWYLAARGATTYIAFDRGSYTYRFVDLFLARGQGEPHSITHGIEVLRNGRRLSFLRCSDDRP